MIPATPFYQGLLGGAIFCIVLGVAGGMLTRLTPWYYALKQPSWKPPDWSIGPIWTTIFCFLTFAIAYAWDAANLAQRNVMLAALAVNGVLNIAWSGIFFVLQKPWFAFLEVVAFWLSIVALIWVMGSISATAGWLLLPYLAWVTTASALNFHITRLNPE
jgi:translocator protein